MTLVIARIYGPREIAICSDSKITFSDKAFERLVQPSKRVQVYGALKTIMLCPETAISYAGDSELAVDFIKEIFRREINIYSRDELLDFFQNNIHQLKNVEFLLSSLFPDARIYKISNQSIKEHTEGGLLNFVYIGDEFAYKEFLERYQFYKHTEQVPPEHIKLSLNNVFLESQKSLSEFQCVDSAFRDILNSQFKAVGGLFKVWLLSDKEKGFWYSESLEVISGFKISYVFDELTDTYIPNFGSAQEGAFKTQVLSKGVGITGLFIYESKLGIIFNPVNGSCEPESSIYESIEDFSLALIKASNEFVEKGLKIEAKYEKWFQHI